MTQGVTRLSTALHACFGSRELNAWKALEHVAVGTFSSLDASTCLGWRGHIIIRVHSHMSWRLEESISVCTCVCVCVCVLYTPMCPRPWKSPYLKLPAQASKLALQGPLPNLPSKLALQADTPSSLPRLALQTYPPNSPSKQTLQAHPPGSPSKLTFQTRPPSRHSKLTRHAYPRSSPSKPTLAAHPPSSPSLRWACGRR